MTSNEPKTPTDLPDRLEKLDRELFAHLNFAKGWRMGCDDRITKLEGVIKSLDFQTGLETHAVDHCDIRASITKLETEVSEQDRGLEASAVYASMSEDRITQLEALPRSSKEIAFDVFLGDFAERLEALDAGMNDLRKAAGDRLDKLDEGMKLQAEASIALAPALIWTKEAINTLQEKLSRTIDDMEAMAKAQSIMADNLETLEKAMRKADEAWAPTVLALGEGHERNATRIEALEKERLQ